MMEDSLCPMDAQAILDQSHQKAMTQWTWKNSSEKMKNNLLTNIRDNVQPSLVIKAMKVKRTENLLMEVN